MSAHKCTFAGCDASFSTTSGLTHHRFGAHGIRSGKLDSQQRHERRDRVSAVADAEWLRKFVPLRIKAIQTGPLNPGLRDFVRRRILWVVTQQLTAELRHDPAEIVVVIADLLVDSLRGTGLSELKLNPEHVMTEVATGQRRVHKTGRRETAVRTA